MSDPNLILLESAAERLQSLLGDFVFVGGATLGLLIPDSAAAPVRPTTDVDVIAEVSSYIDYVAISECLRRQGFAEDERPGAPLCRWLHANSSWMSCPRRRARSDLETVGTGPPSRLLSLSGYPAERQFASSLLRSSWEQSLKHFADEAIKTS